MLTHLRSSDYEVRPVEAAVARPYVARLHYSGGVSVTGTDIHGLYCTDDNTLLGVAWWLPPTKNAAKSVAGDDWRKCVSLSRLVVDPSVPTNGASYLIGRSVRLLKKDGRWSTLVTYADEGEGHTGAIYRATNWEYLGSMKPTWRYRSESGRLMSKKRGPRTYSHQEMIDLGFKAEGPFAKHKFVKYL